MSTIDSDFSTVEIENMSPDTVTRLLSNMMKIMKQDKKDNEVRFVKIQESIDKRMKILLQNSKFPHRTKIVVIRPLPTSAKLKRQVQSPHLT